MAQRIDIDPYAELSRDELYEILELRHLVFVVGQKITDAPEIDGRDPEADHAMLWGEDKLLATARILRDEPRLVVGRVAVHPRRQRQGLGTKLMRAIQAYIGSRPAELHAQAHLQAWYEKLGWRRVGGDFEEAGIPHVMMRWEVQSD